MAATNKALAGKTIVVTRAASQSQKLLDHIQQAGGQGIAFPVMRLCPPRDWSRFDTLLQDAGAFDWIIFSSANAVRFFYDRLDQLGIKKLPAHIAAVGRKTAAALQKRGLRADLVPDTFSAGGLLQTIRQRRLDITHALLPQSDIGRDELARGLSELGCRVTRVVVYRTEADTSLDTKGMRSMLEKGRLDCVTFFSPSAFRFFCRLIGPDCGRIITDRQTVLAAVGPTTAAEIRSAGLDVHIQPGQSSAEELFNALVNYFNTEN